MDDPADRPAPGPLGLVQRFLNAPTAEPTADELQLGDELRRLAAIGESQASLAARFGVSQQLVSAALRQRRLVGPTGQSLATPRTTAAWLAANGFHPGAETLSDGMHRRILSLRDTLHTLAMANNGGPLPPSSTAVLGDVAAGARLSFSVTEGGTLLLAPANNGPERFIEAILVAVFEAQRDGAWPRLKACPADRCQHVFYDSSRNRTATWCSMAICGNRAKVRSYQVRRRMEVRREQP